MRTFLTFILFLVFMTPAAAFAGEPVFCGTPETPKMSTDGGNFCDIHARRLAYRDEAVALKEKMQERARNFAAPRQAAYEQYLKDLEALDERRSSEAYDNTAEMLKEMEEEELVELEQTEPTEQAHLEEVDELEELDAEAFMNDAQ